MRAGTAATEDSVDNLKLHVQEQSQTANSAIAVAARQTSEPNRSANAGTPAKSTGSRTAVLADGSERGRAPSATSAQKLPRRYSRNKIKSYKKV